MEHTKMTNEEEKLTRAEWQELEQLETLDYLHDSKSIRGFNGYMEAQLEVIKDVIWSNPELEKAIMERRYDDLPLLALSTGAVVDREAVDKKGASLFG